MTQRIKFFALIVLVGWLGLAFIPKKEPLTIFMAGDSTMADKAVRAYPETGWGTRFRNFFDNTIAIVNKAQNGRSTRTFMTDGLWQAITNNLKAGDYVLIQFGHNDEVPTKKSYTTEAEFAKNLTTFIDETRARHANPVLITPVARRSFDGAGVLTDTHAAYSEIVRQVAAKAKVPLIDLNRESMALLTKLGPDRSKYLFNHLQPNENSNYPDGKIDNTHFSELGARKMAEIVLADLRKLSPELESRVVKSSLDTK